MFFISSTLSIVFYYPRHFSWVGAGRPCAFPRRGFNRQVTDTIFPLCFSFYPRHFSWVGAGRPCALRSRGFNRCSPPPTNLQMLIAWMIRFDSFFSIRITCFQNFWCPLRPLCFHFIIAFHRVFLFHTSVFPRSAQADLVLFADAVSTAAHHQPPTTHCSPHRLDDSFRFVFFNSIHLLPKSLVSFAPFMFFISSTLSIVFFFFTPPSFLGRRRPTLCFPQTRFQPPGYRSHISIVFSFYHHRLSRVGAGRPCALRNRGFNRRSPPTAHRLDDSFRFVFFNSIHLLPKFYVSFAPFMFSISSKLSIVIYYPHRLSRVGADRPCVFSRRGFNRRLPPTAHRLDDSFRFVFFTIRFTGFQNSSCPLRLSCFSFHQHFPSCFFTTPIFPGSAQADLVPFAAAVLTARLRIPYFPCVFLFTPAVFPGSAQADLVPFAAAVLTAGLWIRSFPCGFLFTTPIFPGSAQADLVLFAGAVSTAA
jgi:hypothetical protein